MTKAAVDLVIGTALLVYLHFALVENVDSPALGAMLVLTAAVRIITARQTGRVRLTADHKHSLRATRR